MMSIHVGVGRGLHRCYKPSLHEHEHKDGRDDEQDTQHVVHADNALVVHHSPDWCASARHEQALAHPSNHG